MSAHVHTNTGTREGGGQILSVVLICLSYFRTRLPLLLIQISFPDTEPAGNPVHHPSACLTMARMRRVTSKQAHTHTGAVSMYWFFLFAFAFPVLVSGFVFSLRVPSERPWSSPPLPPPPLPCLSSSPHVFKKLSSSPVCALFQVEPCQACFAPCPSISSRLVSMFGSPLFTVARPSCGASHVYPSLQLFLESVTKPNFSPDITDKLINCDFFFGQT